MPVTCPIRVRRKIVISINTAWNFVNFRTGLLRALVERGFDVVAVAPADKFVPAIRDLGCRFVDLPIDGGGTHPLRDLQLLARYVKLLRHERPNLFLGFTVKPNIYGSLAARWTGIPVINNVAGLGSVFRSHSWLSSLVKVLYRAALSRSRKVFFQNEDDRDLFIEAGLIRRDVTDRLPGSGIDLNRFQVGSPPVDATDGPRFLLVARLLWDKGVGEYVQAARIVKAKHPDCKFHLLGFLDVSNPQAIPRSTIDEWAREGLVTYLGAADDVRPFVAEADCIVLPSFYREGVPRTLLEAAAMGRPIITTDSVGCREVVEDGINGYLCRPQDAVDLADRIERMIRLSPAERAAMGQAGRRKVESEFDERIVIHRYLAAIDEALST